MPFALSAAMRIAAHVWPAPYTVVGVVLGLLVVALRGQVRVQGRTLEFGGGLGGRLLSHLPAPFSFSAITLGHVVIGLDHPTLAAVRAHEQVHVRQYERWGPLFIPAYLLCSLAELLRGRRPYRDNYFERQAYEEADNRRGARPAWH